MADEPGIVSARAALRVWLPIVAITALHYGTSMEHDWAHDVLRRMYYLPILLAAFGHGLRGGLAAAAVTSLVYLPHAFSLSPGHHHDPGGGVVCVNSVGESAVKPFQNSTARIQNRNTMPNAIVPRDMARLNRLTRTRLR